MASHGRTPRSILHAPKAEVIPIIETRGPNRADRRQGSQYWTTVDKDGNKSPTLHGARAHGFFKRTKRFRQLRDGTVRLEPQTPFALAYPSQNEPYVKPEGPEDDGVSKSWLRRWKRRRHS